MRVLFLVNGLGLGNSTRCHAVIQSLQAKGADVYVMTSGNGLWYFKDIPSVKRVYELASFRYGATDGKISIWKTIGLIPEYLSVLKQNNQNLKAVLAEVKPDVVVTDSVYSFRTVRKSGVPIVALNNSDMVYYSYNKFPDRPSTISAQFHAVEMMDFRMHRLMADKVISPVLDSSIGEQGNKFVRVGPIVRRGMNARIHEGEPKNIVIMLSGSTFGSPVKLLKSEYPFKIDVVGRDAPEGWQPSNSITYHGKIRDSQKLLTEADLVVINGGFSAVSEVFWLRKPMVAVPVPRHAEQWINGRTIQELGVGIMAEEESLEEAMFEALSDIEAMRSAYRKIGEIPDGADQAAEEILKFVI